MKKKILLFSIISVLFVLAFAFSASAENKIIKLDKCPTLEEIHANPDAYISHLDEFDGATYETYRTADSSSVVVMFDNQESPTYYVFPAYYLIRSSYWNVNGGIAKLNETIAAVNASQEGLNAFAGYKSDGGTWGNGECDYIVRVEVPTYVTTIAGQYKFEGSVNVKEVYFPVHTVIDEETGKEKTVSYVTSVSGQNLFSSCRSLEYIHNSEYLPVGIVQGNAAGLTGCSSLKEFKIPYGVTTIFGKKDNGFFQNCSSLTEIVLPNTVTAIGKQAFSGCTSLKTITFGASFSSFYSENSDYETFSYVSLDFVYAPESFVNSVTATSGTCKSIFSNTSVKTIYFITTDDPAIATQIRDNFKATNANKNIGNIPDENIVKYDPTKNYVEIQKSLTSSMIVYGYNSCDAFYESEHIMGEVNSCMQPAACTRKECYLATDASSLPTEHKIKESFVFANGFTDKGVYSCICENASYCTDIDGYTKGETYEAIFEALGYSVKNDGTALMGGYKINPVSLKAYNAYAEKNSLPTVSYGIIISNANGVTIEDGNLTSEFGFKLPANDKVGFSKLNYTITDFEATSDLVNLEFVIALYIEVDGELTFVQSETKTGEAEASVEGEATALNTISLKKVVDITIGDLSAEVETTVDETEKEKLLKIINVLKTFSIEKV